jgi:Zn-dependent M16 (insulinase) family peptidase
LDILRHKEFQMTVTHGFELKKEQFIEELKTDAKVYRHVQTGAEVLSLSNDDENKVFGVAFRTPPSDSTGVAHILEHSVLCGSRKYPVKEPFVELLKGSLQTFLNAFTYPDKTCYPVASQNLKDFYNLIDVYLDAVFYPRLTPFVFQQEGWHLELSDPKDPLIYKGVVFNEMKGAYSSPDSLLAEYSRRSLFPSNAYGLDSGGDPKRIPNLTFERFTAFHKRYYHPSNARVYVYGDDDPKERLRLLNAYFAAFEPEETDSGVPLQRPFRTPERIVRSYGAGEEGSGAKGMVTFNWLLPETTQNEINFALRVLEYVLLGMPGSPLRKALIDSGLGEDIAGEGLGTELRQIYFSAGLKGIEVETADRIEGIVMETLKALVREGIHPHTLEAALNTIEFRLRENNTGHFPRGLLLMLRSLTTWLYGGDPVALLAFEAPLKAVKARVKREKGFFEKMIDNLFLKNTHRTTVVLEPDIGLRQKEEAAEREGLEKIRASMSPGEVETVMANTRELKRLQETPDPPEALASIPVLEIADLDRKNKILPIASLERGSTPVLFHDIFTNGIIYLDVGLNLHALPDRFLSYVPLFGRSLVEMGTEKEDFVSLTQRISRKTGGIRPEPFMSTPLGARKSTAWLFLRAKAMMPQIQEMTSLIQDVLLTARLDNRERFRQMVMEEKARTEQSLIPSGHQVVNLRLKAHYGEAHWAAEQLSGISYLFFLRELASLVSNDWPSVLRTLEEIRLILVNRKAMLFNITVDGDNWSRFEPHLNGLIDALPGRDVSLAEWSPLPPSPIEGLTIPTQVNYVGKGANLYELGYRFHGSVLVLTRYLRTSWLWEHIRVQGGAYGAFCLFDRFSGTLTFVSYRDPNLMKTLEAFDQIPTFLRETDFSEDELTKSIVGTIGDLDAHMLPEMKGFASMARHLTKDTEEGRQKMRDEVLGTRVEDFRTFARVLDEALDSGVVKVLGSQGAIEAVQSQQPGWLKVLKVL